MKDNDKIRETVRESYGQIAGTQGGCCCGPSTGWTDLPMTGADEQAQKIGYSKDDVAAAPSGSNLGLGCGNPQAIARLKPGETVLDLGSGAGFDSFLAAGQVGETGHVIGVDMTPEMLKKARGNAGQGGYKNVEFRLGEIEHLPVADNTVDIILSNCVINLSPDKKAVFEEALRVLKSGGRLAISDVLATKPLPQEFQEDPSMLCGCIGGAASVDEITQLLAQVGFVDVVVETVEESREAIAAWFPGTGVENYVVSASIRAKKG